MHPRWQLPRRTCLFLCLTGSRVHGCAPSVVDRVPEDAGGVGNWCRGCTIVRLGWGLVDGGCGLGGVIRVEGAGLCTLGGS